MTLLIDPLSTAIIQLIQKHTLAYSKQQHRHLLKATAYCCYVTISALITAYYFCTYSAFYFALIKEETLP